MAFRDASIVGFSGIGAFELTVQSDYTPYARSAHPSIVRRFVDLLWCTKGRFVHGTREGRAA